MALLNQRALRLLHAGLAITMLALAAGCSGADSEGDEKPFEVQVGTPPRWDNGVAELMDKKCAVCHQVPAKATAPHNVPQDFDLRYQTASPSGLPGATSILNNIYVDHILRGTMPPEFATPLTDRERDALETWAGNGGP